MTIPQTDQQIPQKPLRLWPGVVAVVLQWLAWLGLPVFVPEGAMYGLMAGVLFGPVIVVWWLFFSRAPWSERVGAIILMIAALAATTRILHESVATGAMGMLYFAYAVPTLILAFVAWAVVGRRLADGEVRAGPDTASLHPDG